MALSKISTNQIANDIAVSTSGTIATTGDLTVDTDTLKVDASEDTVCINTTATDFDAGADDLIVGTGSGDCGITIYTGSSVGDKGSIFFADATTGSSNEKKGQISYEQNNEIMSFFTNATERMNINLNGQVLIGTTTGSGYTNRLLTVGDATTASSFVEIRTTTSGTGHVLFSDQSAQGTGAYTGYIAYAHASDSMTFHTGGGGERLRIDSAGRVTQNASLNGNTAYAITQSAAPSPYGLYIDFSAAAPNNTDNYFFGAEDSSANRIKIYSAGTVKNSTGTYTSFSDERLKSDIVDAKSQWEDIKSLKFKNFIKFDNPDFKQLGLIAQDVEKVCPNLVFDSPPEKGEIKHSSVFGTLYEEGDTIPEDKKIGDVKEVKSQVKNVKDSILYMKAVKALQEAMTRIETLEDKVKALEEA